MIAPQLRINPLRRGFCCAALGGLALQSLAGCATRASSVYPWETGLTGATLALLGEVHDNAGHHHERTAVLRRAFQAGWRPAVVMEQFDTDRQADIERSRSQRPLDAQHLIDSAGAARGWAWGHYVAPIALILQFDLPLVAGNLPRALAARLVREDPPAVFGAQRSRELGVDEAPDAQWQAALEHEIEVGHCGALPRHLLAGMARAQWARDAVMAQLIREHAARGVVLLAGTGHVRRDIGVARWLARKAASLPQRVGTLPEPDAPSVLAVGFIEADGDAPTSDQFDAVVIAAPAERDDPCEAFKARPQPSVG